MAYPGLCPDVDNKLLCTLRGGWLKNQQLTENYYDNKDKTQ